MMVCKKCGHLTIGGSAMGRVVYHDGCKMCVGISSTSMDWIDVEIEKRLEAKTEKLLQLHSDERLPEDVTLIHVPIEKTAYGDYQIAHEHHPPANLCAESSLVYTEEQIDLRWYVTRGQHFFAGYDGITRTLVIGTKV